MKVIKAAHHQQRQQTQRQGAGLIEVESTGELQTAGLGSLSSPLKFLILHTNLLQRTGVPKAQSKISTLPGLP